MHRFLSLLVAGLAGCSVVNAPPSPPSVEPGSARIPVNSKRTVTEKATPSVALSPAVPDAPTARGLDDSSVNDEVEDQISELKIKLDKLVVAGLFDEGVAKETLARSKQQLTAARVKERLEGLDLLGVNFRYRIQGESPFRPDAVFDNGRTTWLCFDDVKPAPALFAINKDGARNYVPYYKDGRCVRVRGLWQGFVLRAGLDSISIDRRR